MILTNVLLNIGLSLVADFANAVAIPANEVPTRIEDLRVYSVGSDFWPVDLDFAHKSGTVFSVRHGVVYFYRSRGSFLGLTDLTRMPEFRGAAKLDSGEVLRLAETTVRRLAREGDPIAGLHAHVNHLKERTGGPDLPFYSISWPDPQFSGVSPAWVEIDARNGRVVKVHLLDRAFYNLAFAWEMKKRAFIPEKAAPASAVSNLASNNQSAPFTSQVSRALGNWLWLCQGLKIDPGNNTNLVAVDWVRTSTYSNPWISDTAMVCRVTFTNGNWFESIGNVVIGTFHADACFIGQWSVRSYEAAFLFEGKVSYRWDDLAKNLEGQLVQNLRIPPSILANYSHRLRNAKAPRVGETGLKNVLVDWTNGEPQRIEYRNGATVAWENHLGLSAEFDLGSGELKFIRFRDPELISALRQAQLASGRYDQK